MPSYGEQEAKVGRGGSTSLNRHREGGGGGGASQVERNQLVECLPKVFKVAGSIPSSAHSNHGGACL